MTRARDTADTQDNSGGAVAPFVAGKNKIINGDFGINQYGLTSTGVSFASTCVIDRWIPAISGATGTASLQPFTPGAAPVAGYESTSFFRMATSVGNDFCRVLHRIEDVRTFAGQTATLSFWAKGTNPTTAGKLNVRLQQGFGTGGSTAVATAEQDLTLTGSWVRYSYTFSVPSVAGQTIGAGSYLAVDIGQLANASTESWTLDLWGVQFEAGSVATPFQTASGTIGGELALCQRYYYAHESNGTVNTSVAAGGYYTGTTYTVPISFPVTMRTAPTFASSTVTSGWGILTNAGLDSINVLVQESSNTRTGQCYNNTQAASTAGMYGQLTSQSASTSLAWSAEL